MEEKPENVEIVLQRGVHHLLRDTDGVPYAGTGTTPTFTIWNCIDERVFEIPNDPATRAFFGLGVSITTPVNTQNSQSSCTPGKPYEDVDVAADNSTPQVPEISHSRSSRAPQEPQKPQKPQAPTGQPVQVSSVPQTTASWRDEKAVKHLLQTWKNYKELFDSSTIRNDAVWNLIAEELAIANSSWVYSGTQCENKFKDVRKNYMKMRDHNNQTGAEPKYCKFYNDMEVILGEKPCVKPVTLASNLKKRTAGTALTTAEEEVVDDEGLDVAVENRTPERKKTRVQKELSEWNEALRADALRREEAREKRHLEGITTFKEVMGKLIDKL